MSTPLNLKQAEQKTYRLIHEDGIIDLALGIMFGTFALIPLFNDIIHDDFWSSTILIPAYILVFLIYRLGKRYITIPRIGLIKFSPQRKRKLSIILAVTALLLFIVFIAGIFAFFNFAKLSGAYHLFVFSAVFLIGFGLASYVLALPRFMIYALVAAAAGPIGEILWVNYRTPHHGIPLMFGLTALIMFGFGIVLMLRFLAKYPIPKET